MGQIGPLKHLVVRHRKSLLKAVKLIPPNKTHKGSTVKCAEGKAGPLPALPFLFQGPSPTFSHEIEGSIGELVSGLLVRWLWFKS